MSLLIYNDKNAKKEMNPIQTQMNSKIKLPKKQFL